MSGFGTTDIDSDLSSSRTRKEVLGDVIFF
jgi:hypothetical protein